MKHNNIYITTLAEEKRSDPQCLFKLHELDNASSPNFPRDHLETFVPQPFEKSTIIHEDPDTFYIAKCGESYIGYSYFRKINDEQLQQGNTAVIKDCWNKGVATALKVRILKWGKERRYKTIEKGIEITTLQ